ncbi:hypothetical protein AN189_09755 [Loktanella sp. 3ANDIMAR09]|uniref:DUF4435 domain-containing protein n=1 Tax=Loktanella sp. 3ANDIMAR09 TaxID=1225657 RepID=UPI0006FE8132|nr:DUF4435 domain-containing protein [Loktanella sp. 3ANDIMAR09]KQI68578.1 hypothetical protein AN189_09755 [Loktanella sp. 3ANDIMAR09]
MNSKLPRPTVDELFQLLKRTSLPTVLVEGVDDIIFYRKIEEDLAHLGLDVLPAGNKESVIKLKGMLNGLTNVRFVFVVDKDLWIHEPNTDYQGDNTLVQTDGYSVENDLFCDGELENLMSLEEKERFYNDITKFLDWYALSVSRVLRGKDSAFRTHPNKVLDDPDFYLNETKLREGEVYPVGLREEIERDFKRMLRGKSLIAILQRQLSRKNREVKFSGKQLIAFGGARRGTNFMRLRDSISHVFKL